jgi:hypothetical protein
MPALLYSTGSISTDVDFFINIFKKKYTL